MFTVSPALDTHQSPPWGRPVRPNRKNKSRSSSGCFPKSKLREKYNARQQKLKDELAARMASLSTLSAEEISNMLDEYEIKHGPVVGE